MDITAILHECKHCSGSGTCTNGENSSSCIACAKKNELPFWRHKNQKGLMCGSCGGIGKAEPMTERLNKRIAPILAILLVISLLTLTLITTIINSQHFSEVLTFSSAIIGTVVGFYFSSNKSNL